MRHIHRLIEHYINKIFFSGLGLHLDDEWLLQVRSGWVCRKKRDCSENLRSRHVQLIFFVQHTELENEIFSRLSLRPKSPTCPTITTCVMVKLRVIVNINNSWHWFNIFVLVWDRLHLAWKTGRRRVPAELPASCGLLAAWGCPAVLAAPAAMADDLTFWAAELRPSGPWYFPAEPSPETQRTHLHSFLQSEMERTIMRLLVPAIIGTVVACTSCAQHWRDVNLSIFLSVLLVLL